MLKISVFELIVAMIPESFLFVIGVYILTNQPFHGKKIGLTGIIMGVATYFFRLLPIYPGTNMIFVTLVATTLLSQISKINIIKSVTSFLSLMIVRLITEWLNVLLLMNVFNLDLNELASKPIPKTLAFLPSIFLFALVIAALYFIKYKKSQVRQDVSN